MKNFNSFYTALKIDEPELKKQIESFARLEQVEKNTCILEPNKYIKWLAIVLEGKVRVWQETNIVLDDASLAWKNAKSIESNRM